MEQENKLRESSKSLKDVSTPLHVTGHTETLHCPLTIDQSMLHEMPNYADIVLSFNPDRSFKNLVQKMAKNKSWIIVTDLMLPFGR